MVLVGNQRAGARELSLHLLKDENDHVTIHDLRGFSSSDLAGALDEAHAASKGTRCRQYLFSLSLNPPESANVATADFEAAIERIEEELGLSGQPRAIVFHEKKGRRHAHCVWSRIRTDMKAVQLSYTHTALMGIARDLYIEHGWRMPLGLTMTKARDPRNFTLAEWQQAKREGKDPRLIKAALQDAWAISDTGTAFTRALEERGYKLAQGDRRGFVAVDAHGEIYSLTRWIGLKVKDLRAKAGNETDLPTLAVAKQAFAKELLPTITRFRGELLSDLKHENRRLRDQSVAMTNQHRQIRQDLSDMQDRRRWDESRLRQSRFRSGLKGLWDFVRGENKRIRVVNEAEAEAAMVRDRAELDTLVFAQLAERRQAAVLRSEIAKTFAARSQEIRSDLQAYQDFRWASDAAPVKLRRRSLER